MVDLVEEEKFWEFVATQNTYVQHKPNGDKLKKEFRFSRFNDEGTIGELAKLGSPRLELRDSPTGYFSTNGGGYHWDNMSRTFRIIGKSVMNDFADKKQIQNDCKKAVEEIIRYIIQEQESGELCANHIIKMFETNNVKYDVIANASSDGSYAGCECTVKFKATIKPATVNYGTFTYPGES